MSGFFQNFLTDAAKGFFGSEYLRDYTHASKTFRSNAYAFAPKFKFLFHVYFDINYALLGDQVKFPNGTKNYFGLAVKTIELPKYSFDLHDMNQYNRKRIVQTKIKYDPVQVAFHDDNNNLIRKLWYAYYTYYYKDATQIDSNSDTSGSLDGEYFGNRYDLNHRSIYDDDITGSDDWGYIGESPNAPQSGLAGSIGASKSAFFKSINIFGFNQHNFVLYKLINPIIESFSHDTYNYSETTGVMENRMTLRYETVKYYDGALDGKNPSKFVTEFGDVGNYDRTLSPIARPGSQASILGQGGLISAAGGALTDLQNGNIIGAIQKAGAAATTFKNPQNILNVAKSEVMSVISNEVTGTNSRNIISSFPIASSLTQNKIVNNVNDLFRNKIMSSPPVPPSNTSSK